MEPGTREDSLCLALQHSFTACASSRIGYTRFHATSLLLQLCLLRERAGLRPREPTPLLRETVRLRPWTRVLFCPELRVIWLFRKRAGLRPRVPTTLLRETVDVGPCLPRTQGSSTSPDGVETRIPTGVEIRSNFRSVRQISTRSSRTPLKQLSW